MPTQQNTPAPQNNTDPNSTDNIDNNDNIGELDNSHHDQSLRQRLAQVRIVMINTTLPANIGSAARAMLTMGLTDLVVVAPKHPIDDESVSHAAGAQSVLNHCRIVESLEQATADCQLVFAASSRQRHIPRPVVTPDQAAKLVLARPPQDTKVAILFGREDRGLTNDELALADYHIQIDANPDYPVLNVASAVQVIASFFYSRFLNHSQQPQGLTNTNEINNTDDNNQSIDNDLDSENLLMPVMLRQIWDGPAISHEQKLKLQSRIIELMYQLQLLEDTQTDKLRDLPSRLSRLLSRLQLDQKEYELLNAIIAKIMLKL